MMQNNDMPGKHTQHYLSVCACDRMYDMLVYKGRKTTSNP